MVSEREKASAAALGDVRGDRRDALHRARIDRWELHGCDGIAAMAPLGRYTSDDPCGFAATIVRARLGRIVLQRTRITPHRATVEGTVERPGQELLRILHLCEGDLFAGEEQGRPVRLTQGDTVVARGGAGFSYRASVPIVVVESTIPVASLPPVVRAHSDWPVGALPHGPLVDSVGALVAALTDRLDEPWLFDADYVARGLVDLEVAILTEVDGSARGSNASDRVHTRAVDFIERHLDEVDLRPARIAAELGVSLRYLYRSFADHGSTVARSVSDRRLDLVAAAVRTDGPAPRHAALAARYGFSGEDQLAKAFRRRFAMSMTAYRSAEHEGPPAPVSF